MWEIIKLKYGVQILKLFLRDIILLCPLVGYAYNHPTLFAELRTIPCNLLIGFMHCYP